ncbi:MAG TPA: LON peptidase substrate-binding domain-containing protein [Alphaproteobacteria bacterium]|nr:LON peptidase substrate-binding domain-containing protein [Alphaproteobacteria bacterium]
MDDTPHSIEDLPVSIPIFPLAGVLLLPRARLPLQMFEPRYVAMTEDAVAGDQVIGMIQPRRQEQPSPDDMPEVFETGCLGRIVEHSTTADGRHLVTLSGVCRFAVSEELTSERGYRRVVPDYRPFADDLIDAEPGSFDRRRFLAALRSYMDANGIDADWEAIDETSDEQLITALAMLCPFAPSEKQALLECVDLGGRARTMTALFEMAGAPGGDTKSGPSLRH